MKNPILHFLLFFVSTWVWGQEDMTRILAENDTKKVTVVDKNENQFVVGSTSFFKELSCANIWVKSFSELDSVNWAWSPGVPGSISQITYDSTDQSFLISMGTDFTDVLPPGAGTRIYRIDTLGNSLQTYIFDQDFNYSNAVFTIHKVNELLLAGNTSIRWFSRSGAIIQTQNYNFYPEQLLAFPPESNIIFVKTSSGKLVQLNDHGTIQWEEDFAGDRLKSFCYQDDFIYTLHNNSIRRYNPSTMDWVISTYDTLQYEIDKIFVNEDYAYVSGIDNPNRLPVYLELDLNSLSITNPILFKQNHSTLSNLLHFKQKVILLGNTNFSRRTIHVNNFTDNIFAHQTNINQEPSFKNTDIAIENINIDPIDFSNLDTFINGPDTIFEAYVSPISFQFEINNKGLDTITSFSIHHFRGFGAYCTFWGNFKKTYNDVIIPPNSTMTFQGQAHTFTYISSGSPYAFSLTAYAPNRQFDQNPEDNSGEIIIDLVTSTGLLIPELEPKINIFPNPTSNDIYIEATEPILGLKIYDSSGRILRSEGPNSRKWRTNLQDLPKGIFWVLVQLADRANWQKIIKQ